MDIVNLIISLVSGVIGGNAAGAGLKDKSLGTLGNSLAGLIGGGAGGYLLNALGVLASSGLGTGVEGATAAAPAFDITTFIANVVSSGVGGAVLTALASWVKNATQKS